MGFVELPGMMAPTGISATGNVSRWRWTTPVAKERLETQEVRDKWSKEADGDRTTSSAGYAAVISHSENKVAFVDLRPLYHYMRLMYFTTQENFDRTKNEGPAPDQWPFAFDVAPQARPRVVSVLPVPKPTAVAAGVVTPRNRGFGSRAFA